MIRGTVEAIDDLCDDLLDRAHVELRVVLQHRALLEQCV